MKKHKEVYEFYFEDEEHKEEFEEYLKNQEYVKFKKLKQ